MDALSRAEEVLRIISAFSHTEDGLVIERRYIIAVIDSGLSDSKTQFMKSLAEMRSNSTVVIPMGEKLI